MPIFEIQGPDGRTYEIDAPDQNAALSAFRQVAPQEKAHRDFDGSHVPGYNPETGMVDRQYGRAGSAAMGAANIATGGFGDEISSYIASLMSGKPREAMLSEIRGNERQAQEQNPGSYLAGQIGTGVLQGGGLAGAGLSAGVNAAKAGGGLLRTAMGSALDGGLLGLIHGAGSGEDLAGRAQGAGMGSAFGVALGLGAPFAVAGASAAAKPVLAPILSRLRPEGYAQQAMGEGVRRSGMSADDIANALSRAQADDQGMFTVADAMGNSGQRMLSTVARTPNDMRQTVVDTLTQRQMGQGERLSQALARGFDAPDTAAQRAARLAAERSQLAGVNYETARQGAGAVDVSGALRVADDIINPGVNRIASPGSNIADDSLEGVVRRARSLLTDGRSNLSDFNSVLRAKQDISDMIGSAQRQGRNNQVRLLSEINSQLDTALERASPAYRAANDAFRAQSRTIDAVDAGKAAASGRTRAADNIGAFQSMPRGEQSAFRAGYADPMISRVESMSISPTTNKARPLMTEKTGAEFPAFAVRGRGDQMGRRIAREQRMFETANAALGGSKTADNLADAAEMSKFEPGVMMNLLRGRPVAAAMDAVGKLANEARGMPPSVMDQIARTLLETNPAAARQILQQGVGRSVQSDANRALTSAILTNLGAAGAGRLAAP